MSHYRDKFIFEILRDHFGWPWAINLPVSRTALLAIRYDPTGKRMYEKTWNIFLIRKNESHTARPKMNPYRSKTFFDLRKKIDAARRGGEYTELLQWILDRPYMSTNGLAEALLRELKKDRPDNPRFFLSLDELAVYESALLPRRRKKV